MWVLSLGTLPVVLVDVLTCGSARAGVSVVDRSGHRRIARSSHRRALCPGHGPLRPERGSTVGGWDR